MKPQNQNATRLRQSASQILARIVAAALPLIACGSAARAAQETDQRANRLSLRPDSSQPVSSQPAQPATSEPASQPATSQPAPHLSLFRDETDGYFDVSNFLSTRVGFLPLAMPITEPAVGYGLALGLTFFHDKPQVVNYPGQPPRVIMPSMTVLFGAGTQNGTWATGIGHIGIWNEGKIRYVGALGYTNLNLDWFGKGDRLGDSGISYTNDILFVYQKMVFKIGDTDFFIGPQYRFLSTNANFTRDSTIGGIPQPQLQSKTGGLGLVLSYDSLDQPFSPTRGIRAEVTYSQQDQAFAGDFDYGRLNYFALGYIPLTDKLILGLRADGGLITSGNAPFYDLPGITMRGIPRGHHVDNSALLTEAELRYDLDQRWSLITFAGAGRVGDSFGAMGSADTHWAVGAGFRYLIARQYGLRAGLDVGYGDGQATLYVTLGTGWVRP